MSNSPFLLIHIAAATVGLLSGTGVMALRKGSSRHRLIGGIFVISMLLMSVTAAYVAAFEKPNRMNVMMSFVTMYLVTTGWWAGRRRDGESGRAELVAGIAGLVIGVSAIVLGFTTSTRNGGPVFFIFGPIVLIGAVSDIRMYVRGGVAGAKRIVRHLWRLSLAYSIAMLSFFLGQQKLFPTSIRKSHVLSIPPLLAVALLIFWMIRVSYSKRYKRRDVASGAVAMHAVVTGVR